MKSTPNSLLVLLPWEFPSDIDSISSSVIIETHAQVWSEEIQIDDQDGLFRISDGNEVVNLRIAKHDDILIAAIPSAPEPFVGSEKLRVENHTHVIHLQGEGPKYPTGLMTKLVSTIVEMGSPAAFVPMTGRIFPQRWVQRATMTPDLQAAIQLLINAWDDGKFMRTRGLTSFGLPEIQLEITEGKNATFFDLMDVAAFCVDRGVSLEISERVQVGHKFFKAYAPDDPTDDPVVSIAGTYGIIELRTR